MMGFGGASMWLFGLLTLAGLALLVIVAVRAFGGGISRTTPDAAPGNAAVPPGNSARQILDERYARGELSTEQYHERLHTLGQA